MVREGGCDHPVIIADTGFWLALANLRDTHHARAREALAEISEPLVTTWPVVTETCHLLSRRLEPSAARRFLAAGRQEGFEVFALEAQHLVRLEILMQRYEALPMDLADASLVLLAEHLGHGRILSTDQRDFQTYRWKHHEPFENLLLP